MLCCSEYGIHRACCLWLWDCNNSQEPVLHVAPHRQTGRRRKVLQARHDRQIPVGMGQWFKGYHRQLGVGTLTHRLSTWHCSVTFSSLILCFFFLLKVTLFLYSLANCIKTRCNNPKQKLQWVTGLSTHLLVRCGHVPLMTNIIGEKREWGWAGRHALWVMEDSDEKMTSHCHLLVLDDTLPSLLVLADTEGRQSGQPN